MTTMQATREIAARIDVGSKIYGEGDTEVRALDGVSAEFEKGVFTAIMGPSGSGKSTLLHCTAGLDVLTEGGVYIGGTELGSLKDKELTLLRRKKVGFVFQAFNLIPTLSARENVLLPLLIAGVDASDVYVTMERNMKCAVGLCGHCQYGADFVCKDGPVFPFSRIEERFYIPEI